MSDRSAMTTGEIARLLDGQLVGPPDVQIRGLAKIEEAQAHQLTFLANPRYAKYLESTRAGAVLVAEGSTLARTVQIVVSDPYASFLKLLEIYNPVTSWLPVGIHPSAVVDPTALLENGVSIGAGCFVGPGARIGRGTRIYPFSVVAAEVTIGEDCVIHSHVSVREATILGNRVVLQDGAVIGSDGFGFVPTPVGYRKIPQLGRVIIGDDVEVGANTTIDRATLGDTMIGAGTKLDNLVQIAHNATVGSHTVVAAQTGVSGSARIGDWCRIGGQVGVVGHLKIGDKVGIGAQSGVANDVASGALVSGSPARSHSLWKRIEAALTRLPELLRRVRRLEKAVFETQDEDIKGTSVR